MEKIKGDNCFRALDLPEHILFYFTANWCRPCQQVSPHMDNLELEYKKDKIRFFKIDIDEDDNLEICQKCDIKQVPVFLLFKDRNFVDKVLGGDISKIKTMIENNIYTTIKKVEKKDNEGNKVNEIFNKKNLVENKELPEFIPSKEFQGYKQYYVFKTDNNGLGYYLDRK